MQQLSRDFNTARGGACGTCLPLTHSWQLPFLWVFGPSFKEAGESWLEWSCGVFLTLLPFSSSSSKVDDKVLMNDWRPNSSLWSQAPHVFHASSYQWHKLVWGSNQWWKPTVPPHWCSCRDAQNRSMTPMSQTRHSRAQTTQKTGRPPRWRWSLVQQRTLPLLPPGCTRQSPGCWPHPIPPGQGCSGDGPRDSQTPQWASTVTFEPASDQIGEHPDIAS